MASNLPALSCVAKNVPTANVARLTYLAKSARTIESFHSSRWGNLPIEMHKARDYDGNVRASVAAHSLLCEWSIKVVVIKVETRKRRGTLEANTAFFPVQYHPEGR